MVGGEYRESIGSVALEGPPVAPRWPLTSGFRPRPVRRFTCVPRDRSATALDFLCAALPTRRGALPGSADVGGCSGVSPSKSRVPAVGDSLVVGVWPMAASAAAGARRDM